MDILTTIPDESVPAWQYRVDQYNAGSNKPPVIIAEFCQGNRDLETAANVDAYNTYQLQQLVPVGVRYIAAPDSVQKQVDALLEPYTPKP